MELLKNEKTEKSTVTLTVKVSKEEFDKANDKAFAKNSKNLNIAGFRKGKAPRAVIEKMYGKDIFIEEAINLCYPEAYKSALEEANIEPVGPADIDVSEMGEDGVTFVFVVPVKPEMKLAAYKELEAELEEIVEAETAQIKAELDAMAQKLSRVESVTRKIKKGDTVNLDFEGFVEDIAFAGGKADGFDLVIGSGQFIPGFEDQLIGAKVDDEVEVSVTFPEEYHSEELKGKPAVFKCTINSVKQTILPKIDDEFAKDVSEFDTLEELKKDVAEKIVAKSQDIATRDFEEKLLDKLIENLEGEIPDVLFEKQTDRIVEDFAYRIQMQGMKIEDYIKMNGMDMDSFRKLFAEQAARQVKVGLALELISDLEKLETSDEEAEAEIAKMADAYNLPVEQIKASIPTDALKRDLTVNKALQFVKDHAKALKVTKAKKTRAKKTKKDEEVSE